MRIPDFSQQTHMARHCRTRMVDAKGILPIAIISNNKTFAAPPYLRKQPPPEPQAYQQLSSESELDWSRSAGARVKEGRGCLSSETR
jgi:hypothetical protein